MKIRAGGLVTLIGYPYDYYDKKNSLPVWKTGHIASEPAVDFEGNPLFVVDVSAFPGMSGAPVFAIADGTYEHEDGMIHAGSVRRLLELIRN
jgi:V8-like Glu-specific endopeptidase